MKTEVDSKTEKKKKFKKRYWLLVDLAIAAFILVLFLYKPANYKPLGSDYERNRIHPYLTYLSSEIYNGAQLQEPFEVVVIEKNINEAIANWSEVSESIILSSPMVRFEAGCIELMATANTKGVEFIASIVLEPEIGKEGLLNLRVAKVKVGAMNITPLARVIARRMYAQQLAGMPIDTEDWRTKIAGAILNGEPFDPIFPAEDKKVRLEQITIHKEKLILRLVPPTHHSP